VSFPGGGKRNKQWGKGGEEKNVCRWGRELRNLRRGRISSGCFERVEK